MPLCHEVHLGEDTIVSSVLYLLPDHIRTCWTVLDLAWTCSRSGRYIRSVVVVSWNMPPLWLVIYLTEQKKKRNVPCIFEVCFFSGCEDYFSFFYVYIQNEYHDINVRRSVLCQEGSKFENAI